ncbi:MAG: c-type cytochrome, partial [Burkholderiales bacterium]
MFTHELPLSGVVLALVLCLSAAYAAGPNLGQAVNPADIAAWDTSVMPDGTGLPAGSGTSQQGAVVYAAKCASCHGDNG